MAVLQFRLSAWTPSDRSIGMCSFCGLLRAPVGHHWAFVRKWGKWEMTAFCHVLSCLAFLLQVRSFRWVDAVLLSLRGYGMNDGEVLSITFPVVVETWVGRGNI